MPMIQIRMDTSLKKEAEEIFAEIGLDYFLSSGTTKGISTAAILLFENIGVRYCEIFGSSKNVGAKCRKSAVQVSLGKNGGGNPEKLHNEPDMISLSCRRRTAEVNCASCGCAVMRSRTRSVTDQPKADLLQSIHLFSELFAQFAKAHLF